MTNLQEMLNGSRPTLVEFYATWCPHCQRMMPIVAQLQHEVGERANIIQFDGDQNESLVDQYKVRSYPTWILFKDGQEVWRDSGEKPLSELKDMIDRFI